MANPGDDSAAVPADAVTGFPKGSFNTGGGGLAAMVLRWMLVFHVVIHGPRFLWELGAVSSPAAPIALMLGGTLIVRRR